jgi:hypothetical protein
LNQKKGYEKMDPPLYERNGFIGAAARFYHRTYIADYIGFILLQAAYLLVSRSVFKTITVLI